MSDFFNLEREGIGRKHPWMSEEVRNDAVVVPRPPVITILPTPVVYHRIPTVRHLPYCPICAKPTTRNVTRLVQRLPDWEW